MVKVYNKLVRDKIPQIIVASGKVPVTKTVDTEEFQELLKEKLLEEVEEFLETEETDELADIFEVMLSIAKSRGISWAEIEMQAEKKRKERGGFEEKIVLQEVR